MIAVDVGGGGRLSPSFYWDWKPKHSVNLDLLGASFPPCGESHFEDKSIKIT